MRNCKRWLSAVLFAGCLCATGITAYASCEMDAAVDMIDSIEYDVESEQQLHVDMDGNILAARRGEVINYTDTGLERYSAGVARVSAEVGCHVPAESIHIRLSLQKWDDESALWGNVDTQDFEWLAEELPAGQELTRAYISYNIPHITAGSYRTKAILNACDEEWDDTWICYSGILEF